ncbi:MAG TPA: hypothetical protein VEY12_06580 [Thermoplasmata archaeon]|nr:hypothetical protein [Thermoplasmata archaeon]
MEGRTARAPTYALVLGLLFLFGGVVLMSLSICVGPSFSQVCGPGYLSTADVVIASGAAFLMLWVVLVALNEIRVH